MYFVCIWYGSEARSRMPAALHNRTDHQKGAERKDQKGEPERSVLVAAAEARTGAPISSSAAAATIKQLFQPLGARGIDTAIKSIYRHRCRRSLALTRLCHFATILAVVAATAAAALKIIIITLVIFTSVLSLICI
jgi:hypothetical protein